MSEYYLAIDIGASSGRHMLGMIEDGKMKLEEIYMENVIDYYKKDCYEKKLFFELVEYQKKFIDSQMEWKKWMEVFAGMLMHYFMRSKKVLKNAKN